MPSLRIEMPAPTQAVVLLAFLLVTTIGRVQAQSGPVELAEDLTVEEIEPDVFLVTHSYPWPANSLVLTFSEGQVLLVDTPYTGEATEQLVDWIWERTGGTPVITAINTHFHNDNLGGNGYLQQIGATVYGSDLTVSLLAERGLGRGVLDLLREAGQEEYAERYQAMRLVPPDAVFPIEEGLTLEFDGEKIEVYYPGPGHAPDNVVVYYPAKNLLFGGCLLKASESNSRGNVGDADLEEWANSVRRVAEKYPEVRLVIPGHGSPGDARLYDHTIRLVGP